VRVQRGRDGAPISPDAAAIRRAWRDGDFATLARLVLTTPTGWTIMALVAVLSMIAVLLLSSPASDDGLPRDCTSCAAEPAASPARWVTTDDYPASALREGQQGVTGFALSIDPAGRITDCRITAGSGHDALDAATCRALRQRGRFYPATDADGRAIQGEWTSRVRWQLP
jgi:TonB family protein